MNENALVSIDQFIEVNILFGAQLVLSSYILFTSPQEYLILSLLSDSRYFSLSCLFPAPDPK